jgi:hypothetical protein
MKVEKRKLRDWEGRKIEVGMLRRWEMGMIEAKG